MNVATSKIGMIEILRGNMSTLLTKQSTWQAIAGQKADSRLFLKNVVRSVKEFEMLVTNKINIFSFLFGKHQAATKTNARRLSRVQKLDDTNLDGLDRRISITKSEDFYKAHSVNLVNPFNQLNK